MRADASVLHSVAIGAVHGPSIVAHLLGSPIG